MGKDILRRGIRRRSASEIRRYRRQTTSRVFEPLLGVPDAQAGKGRPLRGERERFQRTIRHRSGFERSSQVYR